MSELIRVIADRWTDIVAATGQHIVLALTAIFWAVLISLPIGIALTRYRKLAGPVLAVASILQTIPSLALLGFMIPLFGIGSLPAVIAMILYALLPIMRNTYTGIRDVNPSLLEAGKGMGMTGFQLLTMVKLPLARPMIFAGIRTATVMTIGVATLASFIGGGGLGDLILRGIAMTDTGIILAGAIPAALLAILFDMLLASLDLKLTPKGLRVSKQH
ncbi:ABC transporter permease [Paenibacillus thalictri]|uniref:ABC transporter permease n=1 Tax=Paenibacillus thalictri TaxID=2527873 RepID=A0A4Q9DEJ7_9BACL|nr:ABC transporter permease [Paenibacillus thalictri]TBL68555.1 ABC transporter permease [Paenibacillus thalictri]